MSVSTKQIRALREIKGGTSWDGARSGGATLRSCIARGWAYETGHNGRICILPTGIDVLDAYKLGRG